MIKSLFFCAFDKDYNVFRAKVYSENLFYHLGFKDIKKCVFMDQIHSHKVIIYEKNLKNLSCDGLISKEKKYRSLCFKCGLSAFDLIS